MSSSSITGDTNLTSVCASLYAPNATYTASTPRLLPPNDTILDVRLYNFVTVTQGPRANTTAFFYQCFNTWECYSFPFNNDCYFDVQAAAIESEGDYNTTIDCLDSLDVPYQVFYAGGDPLTSGAGGYGGGRKGWTVAMLGALVVVAACLGVGL